MNEKRVYEFNLENLSIRHFLLLNRFSILSSDPQTIVDFMKLGAEFCDFDPLDLPFSEFENFTSQLGESLAIAFRKPDSDVMDK
jgi:hypothetical protein